MNILIISEEPKLRNSLAGFLRSEGFAPAAADSLQGGIDVLERDSIDLIFSSDKLKDVSPSEICERIRASSGGTNARLVALSQSKRPPRRELAHAGFDAVLDPGSDADEIALQYIVAARSKPVADDASHQNVYLETLNTLGFYLSHGTSAERQAQHTLHAINELYPGTKAAVWLRGENDTVSLLCAVGLSNDFATVGTNVYTQTTADWSSLGSQPPAAEVS